MKRSAEGQPDEPRSVERLASAEPAPRARTGRWRLTYAGWRAVVPSPHREGGGAGRHSAPDLLASVRNLTQAPSVAGRRTPGSATPGQAIVHFVVHQKTSARPLFRVTGPNFPMIPLLCEGGDLNPYGVTR
jgi:hypothetical protein